MSTTVAAPPSTSSSPGQEPPGPLAPSRTLGFASSDGTELYGEWFPAEEACAAALVMHGYLEHCGRYRELAHVLVNAGVATLTYDMRGHGRAQGQRSYIAAMGDYLDDMEAALESLDRCLAELPEGSALPRVIVAHSNGALILLRALVDPVRAPEPLAAVVLSSPFLGFKHPVSRVKDLVGKMAGRWMPALSLPSNIPVEHLTSDPDKQRERRLDTLCNDVASSGWYLAAHETQSYVAAHAPRIEVPSLWLVSGADRVADPAASRAVHERTGGQTAYHELEGFEHEVFNERERGRAFDLLNSFLKQIIQQG